MTGDPVGRYADLLRRFPTIHDQLREVPDVGELLSRGARLACQEASFARGVVVGVRDGVLSTDAMDSVEDPDSDALRRRILSDPPSILPGTLEAELLRLPQRYPEPTTRLPSVLADRFDLADPAFGVIAPENSLVGLLVLDRPQRRVEEFDRTIVTLFGRLLSVVLEHVVLRARIAELSAEMQYLTVSVQALAREAFDGPVALPVHGRHLPTFRSVDSTTVASERAREALSEREFAVAELLAAGRTNKEIADQLFVSVETVKDNVARVIRKLGASNRVDAAVRFYGVGQKPPSRGR